MGRYNYEFTGLLGPEADRTIHIEIPYNNENIEILETSDSQTNTDAMLVYFSNSDEYSVVLLSKYENITDKDIIILYTIDSSVNYALLESRDCYEIFYKEKGETEWNSSYIPPEDVHIEWRQRSKTKYAGIQSAKLVTIPADFIKSPLQVFYYLIIFPAMDF